MPIDGRALKGRGGSDERGGNESGDEMIRDVFVQALEAEGLSPETIKRRRLTLDRFYMACPELLEATPADITSWLANLAVKPQTRNYYLSDLRAFYAWAEWEEFIEVNPAAKVRPPKRKQYQPRPISAANLRRAMDAADGRMLRMLRLAAHAGLRVSEVASIKREDFDFGEAIIYVRGKGDKVRRVPLAARLRDEVIDSKPGNLVWNEWGDPMTPNTISRLVGRHLDDIGAPEDTAHSIRHYFATRFYAKTKDLRLTQEVLGHASPATTAKYVAFDGGRAAQDAVDGIGDELGDDDEQIAG